GGAHVCLAAPQPPPAHPLRAPRRHAPGVPPPRLRAHLLATAPPRPLILLGVLSSPHPGGRVRARTQTGQVSMRGQAQRKPTEAEVVAWLKRALRRDGLRGRRVREVL